MSRHIVTRCRRCLGMGYKGRTERGAWKIRNCPRCGGNGVDPRPETLPENRKAPPCVVAMGCLCAGHARGSDASEACDTTEG